MAEAVAHLREIFAQITYPNVPSAEGGLDRRKYFYHSIFYLSLKLLGYNIRSEVVTAHGRIDAVIETEAFVYVIEFKVGAAETAVQQIQRRKYHKKFLGQEKKIILLGLGFDVAARNIGSYRSKVLP